MRTQPYVYPLRGHMEGRRRIPPLIEVSDGRFSLWLDTADAREIHRQLGAALNERDDTPDSHTPEFFGSFLGPTGGRVVRGKQSEKPAHFISPES